MHPYPVVLVHGTFGNMQVSWNAIVPPLKRLGYCVFALDYGNSPLQGINGTGDIPTSAGQLKTFIGKVLRATGAAKVSIVGHSQGGMMPRYYMKFLGGVSKVDDLVGLSPSNHGTTTPTAPLAGPSCPACTQQVAGSEFMTKLNAGDETPAPASYTVIETNLDEVVTPYQSEFLPKGDRVTNILLQDRCLTDSTEHVGIIQDAVAIQWMLGALGRPGPADPAFVPDCMGGAAALAKFPNSSSVTVASLRLGGLRHRRARSTGDRRIRLRVRASGSAVGGVRVVLRRRRFGGRVLGHSQRLLVRGRRSVRIRLRHQLAAGRYFATAAGKTESGQTVTVTGTLKLR